MRKLFPGHYPPNLKFKEIVNEAVFVFDTNVLINFYRLGSSTQAKLFEGLTKIADKCWLPYHVAQEFQSQRQGRIEEALVAHTKAINTIAEIKSTVEQVCSQQDVLEQDPDTGPLIAAINKAVDELVAHATLCRETLPQRSSVDPIAEQLADIFDDRVGPPPTQTEVDAINAEGETRYRFKLPPGYTDEKKNDQAFKHGGVVYQSKYGDLYIWKQTLSYVATLKDRRHLVFVTDEKKSDWWKKGGGPDVRLAHELATEAKGWFLWMYSSDRFFEHLGIEFGLDLEDRTLEELKHAADDPIELVPENWPTLMKETATYNQNIKEIFGEWVMQLNPSAYTLQIREHKFGLQFFVAGASNDIHGRFDPKRDEYGQYILWNWGLSEEMDFPAACRFASIQAALYGLVTTLVLNVTGVSDSALNGLLFSASHSTMPTDPHGEPTNVIIATCEDAGNFVNVIYADGDKISGLQPIFSRAGPRSSPPTGSRRRSR